METVYDLLKCDKKDIPVPIIQEYTFSLVSSGRDMINSPGKFNAH